MEVIKFVIGANFVAAAVIFTLWLWAEYRLNR